MIDVHNKLLEWREFYRYKQKQVAEAIGVNRATYANYECGRRSPDIEGLVKLATFYGISLNELVGCRTGSADNPVLMIRDRELLDNFHKLPDVKQKACLAHMKLDVELETNGQSEFRDKE